MIDASIYEHIYLRRIVTGNTSEKTNTAGGAYHNCDQNTNKAPLRALDKSLRKQEEHPQAHKKTGSARTGPTHR